MSNDLYRPPRVDKIPVGPVAGAAVLAVLIFLALPLTQLLSNLQKSDKLVRVADVNIPPPEAPPPEPPPPEEEEVEEEKPELEEEMKPLDISQLEAALNPGFGDALNMGQAFIGFGMTPDTIAQMDIFELKDLDNNPRRIFAARPIYPYQFKREGIEGWVRMIIIIDERGNVIDAKTQRASHKEFIKPAVDALLQWRFEPGTRNGKPVKVRRIQPIAFKLS